MSLTVGLGECRPRPGVQSIGARINSSRGRKAGPDRAVMGMVILALVLCGCSREEKPKGSFLASTELEAGRPPNGVDSIPSLILGTAFGTEDESFSGDIDATILSDGRVVVADGGARQLKFFGKDGEPLVIVGGRGGGPGEFLFLSQVSSGVGDTIFAGDWRQISRFSPDGAFIDRIELDHGEVQGHLPPGQVRSGIELIEDAGLIFISTTGAGNPAGEQGISPPASQAGIVRFPTAYQFVSFDFRSWDSYGGGLGPESISPASIKDRQVPGIVPFLAQTVHAPSKDGRFLALGDSRSGTINLLSRGGQIEGTFTHLAERAPLSRSQRMAWVEWFVPNRYRFEELERNWVGVDLPEEPPAFSSIRVDSQDFIWVLDYDWPRSGKKRVICYDPAGNVVGEFHLEGVSKLLEIEENQLVGLGFDEFDVPKVLVFSIERNQ